MSFLAGRQTLLSFSCIWDPFRINPMKGSLYDLVLKPAEKIHLGKLRDELLASAHGRTLEIGAGTGLNFSHYPPGLEIIATDYDEDMLAPAKGRSKDWHIRLEVADVQNLPYQDECFDTVVATLVFCSVENPYKGLAEVYRVLKPGGSFLLLEHVRKNTLIAGTLLDGLTPMWKHLAGGCHLNRDPEDTINALGFETVTRKILWSGLGKMWHLKKI